MALSAEMSTGSSRCRVDPRTGLAVLVPRKSEPVVTTHVEVAIDRICAAIMETEDWSTTADLLRALTALTDVRNELKA